MQSNPSQSTAGPLSTEREPIPSKDADVISMDIDELTDESSHFLRFMFRNLISVKVSNGRATSELLGERKKSEETRETRQEEEDGDVIRHGESESTD